MIELLAILSFLVAAISDADRRAKNEKRRDLLVGSKLPSLRELRKYCADSECTEVASWIEADLRKYHLKREDGGYLKEGRYRDHAWVSAPDGTIVDTTHGQFDPEVPILIARPGSPEHGRYLNVDDMTDEQRVAVFGPP